MKIFTTALLLGALTSSVAFAQNTTCEATKAAFDQLKNGMSQQQVEEIIGCEGEVMSETEFSGIRTVMLVWTGEGSIGANMNAMFQGDKLLSKAQIGLR